MPLSRYGAIVCGFHEFLMHWEAAIRIALPERLRAWFDERRHAHFAAQDIAHLGLNAPTALCDAARSSVAGLTLDAMESAFGSMYVIEGSTLGGQVITPLLQTHLNLAPGQGASYFHGYGDRTGAMWREFRNVANQEVGDDETAIGTAAHSAAQTFSALIRTFQALPP